MSVNNFETIYYGLFKQHYSALLFYATRLVGEDDAEDIVQDVFVELWNNKSKIDFDDHIKSFLYKSVYTRSINFLKHKSVVDSYTSEEKEFFAQKIAYYNYVILRRKKNFLPRRLPITIMVFATSYYSIFCEL